MITFIPIPEKYCEFKPMCSHHRDTMTNTVRQLMYGIRLYYGTECSTASSWRQARTKIFFVPPMKQIPLIWYASYRQVASRNYIFCPDFVQIATLLASSASARHCLFWIIYHRRFHYFFRPVLSKGASKAKIVWHLSMLL